MRDILNKVRECIKKYNMIDKDDTVICGLSGGPDSVLMLYILNSLKDEFNYRPVAVHINHMIRANKADEDMEFSKRLAGGLNIKYYGKKIDVPAYSKQKKISEEAAGRKIRYEYFRSIARKYKKYKIAVAHNADDVAETFIFNLARGTGLEGMCSIKRINDDVIRPLLDISKKDILDYLNNKGMEYKIDQSNNQNHYTRNKIRNIVIPMIDKQLNANITEKILNTVSLLNDDFDYLEDVGKKAYRDCKRTEKECFIDVLSIQKYHIAIKRIIIRLFLRDVIGNIKGFGSYHINSIVKLTDKNVTSLECELPKGYVAVTQYGKLKIRKNRNIDIPKISRKLNIPGETVVETLGWKIKADIFKKENNFKIKIDGKHNIEYFDYDKIVNDLFVRNRKNGDVFKPFGMKGTKKIKDYFIDRKIKKEKRDIIPLIENNSGILWIAGCDRSNLAKITDETKKVLRLRYTNIKGELKNA